MQRVTKRSGQEGICVNRGATLRSRFATPPGACAERPRAGGRAGTVLRVGLILALALGGADASFAADEGVQRVEAVGIYGIREAMRSKVIARDEAIADARWEGVSRVALELIGESGVVSEIEAPPERDGMGRLGQDQADSVPPLERRSDPADAIDPDDPRFERTTPTEDQAEQLALALGKDMLPYTRGYRILEDQGERPVLFADEPGIDTEYVVVVEVVVDVDRVSKALEDAGLVSVASSERKGQALTVEVLGLARYEALERVLAALRGPLRARSVATLEFERERQLLSVQGPFDVEQLAAGLRALRDPQLTLQPVAMDPIYGRLRVLARWSEAAEEADSEAAALRSP